MANVLNRTTRQYIASANTPEYPLVDWIHNPDLSAVTGFASKYWIITGDNVTLMDQSSRDAVDAAELDASKDGTADQMDAGYAKAFAEVLVDEINILRSAAGFGDRTLAQLKTAVRSKL